MLMITRKQIRHGAIHDEAEHHEYEIRVLAPDIVRRGCPEEPACHVEQAQQAYKAGRRHHRNLAGEYFLAHG